MRHLFFTILCVLALFSSCGRNEKYVIHGNLRCVNAQKAYMMEMTPYGKMEVIDSTPIHGGNFRFRGHVDYPTMRFIKVGSCHPFDVFVENNEIHIKGSVLYPDEITITGSTSQNEFLTLLNEYNKNKNKRSSLLVNISNAKKKGDKNLVKKLKQSYKLLPDSLLQTTQQFVSSNPTSVGAAYFVCFLTESYDVTELEPIIHLFAPSIGEAPYVKYLQDELCLSQKFGAGSKAHEFNIPSIDGDTITLRKYEGKYLYIDFGASWCPKTESRNSILRKLYSQYHELGLEILSVSLDSDEDQWHEFACQAPELPWEQASDLLYWASPITKYYHVNKIPYGVLISPKGRIIRIDANKLTLGDFLKKNFAQ